MPEIKFKFQVNRAKTTQAVLAEMKKTGWTVYGDLSILAALPEHTNSVANFDFFPSGTVEDYILVTTLQEKNKELEVDSDVQAFVQYAEAHPDLADECPMGMQWQDENGEYCYVLFGCWDVGRDVSVFRLSNVWNGRYVSDGHRKPFGT